MALPLIRVVRGFIEPRELNPVLKGTAPSGLRVLAPVRPRTRAGGRGVRRAFDVTAIASLRADRVTVRFRRPFPVAAGDVERAGGMDPPPGGC